MTVNVKALINNIGRTYEALLKLAIFHIRVSLKVIQVAHI